MAERISEERDRFSEAGILYRTNVRGARLTTFGSGGSVAFVVFPKSVKELLAVREITGRPLRVIGGGSNVILPPDGFGEPLVRLDAFDPISFEKERWIVGAGVKMPAFAKAAEEMEQTGVEFASGIPGTVGGALKTNASAFGQAISDGLLYLEALVENEVVRIRKDEAEWAYHRAILPKEAVVLSAAFALKAGDRRAIRARVSEMREKRRATQPRERSAGSVFRKCGEIPAAIYIEKTGLKGLKIGGARLSEKHCNFIVNEGGASSNDFFEVAETVRKKALETQGVTLEYEVEKIGW